MNRRLAYSIPTITRRLGPLLGGALLLTLAAGMASAAVPQIGGSISPSTLYLSDSAQPSVVIGNPGTIPVTATLTIGSGWALDRTTMALAPGQTATVAVSYRGGASATILSVRMTGPGMGASGVGDAVGVTVAAHVYRDHGFVFTPPDLTPYAPVGVGFGLAVALYLILIATRRLRRQRS